MLRDDAAIQLALGESQIVKDIQTYLEDNGVKVRSKTILKNNRIRKSESSSDLKIIEK